MKSSVAVCLLMTMVGPSSGCLPELFVHSSATDTGIASNQPPQSTLLDLRTLGLLPDGADLISIRPHTASSQTRVRSAVDLNCDLSTACLWANQPQPSIAWRHASFSTKPNKPNVKQSGQLPDSPFLLASSGPRRFSSDNAQLTSALIQCQTGDGTLSFRHWRWPHSDEQQSVQLSVCAEKDRDGVTSLECFPVAPLHSNQTTVNIPGPSRTNFKLIISAWNFVAEPGSFVAIDDIKYSAQLGPLQRCQPVERNVLDEPAADSLLPPTTSSTARVVTTSDPQLQYCRALTCNFNDTKSLCDWNGRGRSAEGIGRDVGWTVTNAQRNSRTNTLTGIRHDPLHTEYGTFALAQIPDRYMQAPGGSGMRYVLQSPPVSFQHSVLLSFYEYNAIYGVALKVCHGTYGPEECEYQTDRLSKHFRPRKWYQRLVTLPAGRYKVFIVVEYTNPDERNAGQIGIWDMKMYQNEEYILMGPWC